MIPKEQRDREIREVERLIQSNRDGIVPAIAFEIRTQCREIPCIKLVIPKTWLFKRVDASDSQVRRPDLPAGSGKKGWLIGKNIDTGKDAFVFAFIPETFAGCSDLGDAGLVDLGLWGINRNGNESLMADIKDFKSALKKMIRSVGAISLYEQGSGYRDNSLTFKLVRLRDWLRLPSLFSGSFMKWSKKIAIVGVWVAKKRTCLRMDVPKRWIKIDKSGYDVLKIQTRRDFKLAIPDDAMIVVDGIRSESEANAGLFKIVNHQEERLVSGASQFIAAMFQRYMDVKTGERDWKFEV